MNKEDILQVNHLSMRFGGLLALHDVNFSVKKDHITALIGPNGAGKTTLFNCLTGFYTAQSGELLLRQNESIINIRKLIGEPLQFSHLLHPLTFLECLYYKMFGGSHLCARLGITRTFQNIRLFRDMTVIENLLVAQYQFANKNLLSGLFNTKSYADIENKLVMRAFEWLDIFNLTKDANRLAGELAYGKQRHLEIARAMCANPSLLCLDEPAAGLNPVETSALRNIILSLQREHQVTILLIEHDMSLVMNISDHIVVLDHGEVICEGTPDIVRHDKRVIEAYLGIEYV
jgi:branched-chain amino acid transport system ATP-binding protein